MGLREGSKSETGRESKLWEDPCTCIVLRAQRTADITYQNEQRVTGLKRAALDRWWRMVDGRRERRYIWQIVRSDVGNWEGKGERRRVRDRTQGKGERVHDRALEPDLFSTRIRFHRLVATREPRGIHRRASSTPLKALGGKKRGGNRKEGDGSFPFFIPLYF